MTPEFIGMFECSGTMQKFTFDDDIDAAAELERLLEYNGFQFRRDGENFRFWFSDRGFKWETACVCLDQSVLIYGIYPFPVIERKLAFSIQNEVNSQVLFGALFLTESTLIFRTCADLFDPYNAYETIGRALEYNAGVMVKFWRRCTACSVEGTPSWEAGESRNRKSAT